MERVLEKVHEAGRCCIAIHPSSEYMCIGGCDGFIKQYSYGLSNKSLTISNAMDSAAQYHDDPIHEISFCQSGDYFAICCDDGEAVLFRHPDCSVHSLLAKYDCAVSSISFLNAPHSFLLALSSDNGMIKIINALDYETNHFEFKCCQEGIRNIKFIPFAPDPFRTSREKYLAVARCDGTFAIWKIIKTAIFDANITEISEKVVQCHEFSNIFPKIKGGDVNQRLDFDSTPNGALIAIPGSTNIKLLDTKQMKLHNETSMTHRSVVNCCAFNPFLEESGDTNTYILASSDISGNMFIWSIAYNSNDGIFKCVVLDEIAGNVGICSVMWRNRSELMVSNMNSEVFKYNLKSSNTVNTNDNNTEQKEAEAITDKKKTDPDSEEDFDIDMNNGNVEESPNRKVLKRSFEDSDSSPSPQKVLKPLNDKQSTAKVEADPLQAELAAAAEMFGDNDNDSDHAMNEPNESSKQMDIKQFHETEAVDSNASKMEEEEDAGEDLNGFIVASDEAPHAAAKKYTKEESVEEAVEEEEIQQNDRYQEAFAHEAFMNGQTLFDEDGQRYLLFNKIGAVIVRKQDTSSNAMQRNNIMSSLHHGKYCIEIDFFDKSQYSRAVSIKSDHHFTCCDVNSFGLLLGSQPVDNNVEDDIKESIVRYKPIARNGEYRSFASEKDCEWNHRLPIGEVCVSVTLTPKYAVIATNKRYLRILSIGGLQVKHVISLPKNVIHIAGNNSNDTIAITFDDLSLWILDLNENKKVYDGYCAVTNSACCVIRVFIAGQEDNLRVITVDSERIVRVLCSDLFDWNWIAALDINDSLERQYTAAAAQNQVTAERPQAIWPVYFDYDEDCLMVMELKDLDEPKPSQMNGACVLTEYKLSVPLLGVGANEIDPMTNEAIIRFANKEESILTQAMLHTFSDTKQKKQNNKKLLKEYITLFNHACKVNRYVLAYDIALHCLDTEKALSNGIKIAMHHQVPLLAEQITNLTKQRMKKKAVESTDSNNSNSVPVSNLKNSNKNQIKSVKKPSRSLGKLRRPTAKLGGNRKTLQENQNEVNDVMSSMQRTKLTGKKRPNPPFEQNQDAPSAKKSKRNPFSCNTATQSDKKSNSIFNVE